MIRPIMAILIAASIILFVWQYAAFTERIRPEPIQILESDAEGKYDVKIVCTFDCQGNAFGNSALNVKFRDRVLIDRTDEVAAGEVILIEDVPDIKQGLNDFLVQVTPVEESTTAPGGTFGLDNPSADSEKNGIARAVRVEILHNGYVIADELFWSNASGPFGELVKIKVNKKGLDH